MFPIRFDLRTASPEECKAFIACSRFFECTEQPQNIVETWDYWTYPRIELFETSEENVLFVADFDACVLYAKRGRSVIGRRVFTNTDEMCNDIALSDMNDMEAEFGVC